MENYKPLDFDSRDISFAFRDYSPSDNVHAEKKSHDEIKSAVLKSLRMRKVMREVSWRLVLGDWPCKTAKWYRIRCLNP